MAARQVAAWAMAAGRAEGELQIMAGSRSNGGEV
jgi:hypothetical protein